MENQITKGKWIVGWGDGLTGSTTLNIYNNLESITVAKNWPYVPVSVGKRTICGVVAQPDKDNEREPSTTEMTANAQLIAEAGNVTQETGKTPRQLADENKMLLEALKEALNDLETNSSSGVSLNPSWKQKAIEAINKATK